MSQIIACIDTSPSAQGVCQASAWCGLRLSAPVLALHAIERNELAHVDLTGAIGLGAREHLLAELAELDHQRAKLAIEQGRVMLSAAEQEIQAAGHLDTESMQQHASLSEALSDLSESTRVVVLGRQGQDHAEPSQAVGSQLETIVRLAEHPVLVTPRVFQTPTQAVIAYDGSATAERMLDRLCASPLLKSLPIEVVLAGTDDEPHQEIVRRATEKLAAANLQARSRILNEEPLLAIRELAQQPDTLLCMGAYGHSRIREFLIGSTTTETLRHAKCSVLLIR